MRILFTLIVQICVIQLSAQYTFFKPKEAFAIEVSLENSTLKRLPIYRNAITSLAVAGDNIIGGTTANEGLTPFIFTASLAKREMVDILDLNKMIGEQRSIRTGFCKGKNNVFYAGTIANLNEKGENQDGHLIEVRVDAAGSITVKDMGVPVPGEGVFSLTVDSKGSMLYGIAYPSGIFFSYSIATKAVNTHKDIMPTRKDISSLGEYVLNPEDYLCKALIEGPQGQIIGSLPINKLFSFNPAAKVFRIYENALPEVWGHRVLGQVESWTKSKDGRIFGGNAGDGQLFQFDPVANKVKNLGKPIMMPGLRGLVFARDGKLYGIAGGAPGYSHLFSYSPGGEGFHDYGNPQFTMKAPGIEQGIDSRGFQLVTIATSADGKYVVMGEDESLSHLLIFAVESGK